MHSILNLPDRHWLSFANYQPGSVSSVVPYARIDFSSTFSRPLYLNIANPVPERKSLAIGLDHSDQSGKPNHYHNRS